MTVGLITRRSQVQILSPPPKIVQRPRSATWAFHIEIGLPPVYAVFLRRFLRCSPEAVSGGGTGRVSRSAALAASACMPGRMCW